jgi:ABC-type transport system involved in multi-copper enzyme maturation permease subunit
MTIARLVRADITKLSRYWVVVAGYVAIVIIAIPGAMLTHFAERAASLTSSSGYDFAFSLMLRCLDMSTSILYVMICIIFALDVANSTVKYILTRPVTRMELLLSKYVTAALMIVLTLVLLWTGCLGAGWAYYGLGDLTENEYVIFEAGTMFKHIAIATFFLTIGFAATASMAIAVSSYSSTMGGAIIVGLILYSFFGAFTLVPASLGVSFEWGGKELMLPYSTLAFPNQIFVPMYVLEDLPTGIPIESWWTWDILRMSTICAVSGAFFFAIASYGVRKRDFTL